MRRDGGPVGVGIWGWSERARENLAKSADMDNGMGKGFGYGEEQWAIHSILDVDGHKVILED